MPTNFPTRISFAEAGEILERVAAASQLGIEKIALSQCLGRVLAIDVISTLALPGFDNSAMDGFALRSADAVAGGVALLIVGEQFAGASLDLHVDAGQCVRITTGAPLPTGADAVVMKEDTVLEGDRIVVGKPIRPGQHVRRAGEDVSPGDKVLSRGQVLSPAALSLAASIGLPELDVHRRPTVAVFTSGDELKPPGQALQPGEIHDSNRVLLQTLLRADGYEPVAWPVLPDDPARIAAALTDAAFSFDVVITCGGVSAGEKDFLPAMLARLGEVYFWKVRMRPGMPVLVGRLGSAHLVCLPGNPVSVFATYLTLARRFLDRLQARATPRTRLVASLSSPLEKTHDRLEFLRGSLACNASGQLQVAPNPADGSHRLRAVADSNCLIVLPEGAARWEIGSLLEVLPMSQL
ncbi:MAG: molybdopterin molybdenumtransferase MoeA [Gammaproteobacteria bacterium RIFCSPHIGHO2_12_FULL_63_22]|nr:MAG: molybdopterin molybdenumtransferase MoeA [Gammaproteobacteria bacterium RIFCSPHIGHO2_12_FULL_63_22]